MTNTDYALEAAEHEIKRLEAKNDELWTTVQMQLGDIRKLDSEVWAVKFILNEAEMSKRTWMFVAGFAVVISVVMLAR